MILKRTKRLIVVFFGIIAFFLFTGFLYETISSVIDERKFPPLGKLVDMDGYRLHLIAAGNSGPTVVLESGLGAYSLDWALVQPSVAEFACVYSYDRAGYGWSDESPNERTCACMVEELHTLLEKAGAKKPYILVGHSLGGANARLYASRYPEEVAGIVLVDAAHEDQFEKMPKFSMPSETIMLFLTRCGFIRFLSSYSEYQAILMNFYGKLPADIQQMRTAQIQGTKGRKTAYKEFFSLQKSLSQLKEVGTLGDIPLIVITAMQIMPSNGTGVPQEEIDLFHKEFLELQKDLLNKSTKSIQVFASESDHSIPMHQPGIIVDAIRTLVEKIDLNSGIYFDPKHEN